MNWKTITIAGFKDIIEECHSYIVGKHPNSVSMSYFKKLLQYYLAGFYCSNVKGFWVFIFLELKHISWNLLTECICAQLLFFILLEIVYKANFDISRTV